MGKSIDIDEWNKVFDSIVNVYSDNEITKKMLASAYESIAVRGANYLGDIGMFDKSDEVAMNVIKLEMECERMYGLSTALYCVAWNRGVQNKLTYKEIELCEHAYVLAKYSNDVNRMELYRKWIEKNSFT